MDDRAAFVRAIEAAPWNDPLPRQIYADWLDEHGEVEEAARQRRYVDSEKWLREFADTSEHFRRRCYDDWGNEDDKRAARQEWERDQAKWKAARRGELTHSDSPYEELLYFLTAQATAEGEDDYSLPFDTPYGFSDYSDELWHHFEVVTGIRPPEKYRYELPPFRCAC